MPDIKNNIKVIYNALAKEGYNDLGSEQEFAESMADENNRKLVYNTLKGKEFADVKDYDSFSNMVYQQPRAEQQQEEEMKPVKPAKIDPRFVAPNVGKPTDAQPIMKSVQQDTGFAAPQDYNSQNAFLSNVDKDYNVASHIPDAQQPIKMYGADSNLGEVIDNLYTVYDEAYKKDNPKKIAEAANMARSMGLDNEQAEKALTLVHGLYSQNVANNIADYMYSRMNNGDPLYALKEVYYNKDFQKKLKDTTTRLGLDNTQGFVEYYLKPALQRKLENERGFTDTVNFGVQSGSDDVAKNTEVFEKRKAEEDLLQKQVDAMNAEGKRIEEKGQQMYDPNYKNRPWWADLIPVEGGGRSAYDEAEGIKRNSEAEELMRTGQAMQRMADDAQAAISEDNILRTRKTDGLTNQIKNAFGRILRGGAKTATDIRTWDFGFTDLKDATVIKAAADAYANNRATAAQKALLNAVALKNAVMGKHGDALGGLYGASGTSVQMIPFMAQFAFSPVKGVGPAAQKYCRTQLEKAFGKYATEAVGKFVIKSGELAGRFAGDVAQGAAMTTIFNMPAVAADTHKRMTGDLEATTDSKGNIVYSGKRTNVKSGGRAFAEAFTAQTIENQSELFGEYLKPLANFTQKGAAKAMDKWGLSKTKNFLTGINNKQIMKSFNRFTKNTEWNGLFGEVGEEIVGNFENAFTVGDLNLNLDINDNNSVFSKKVNTDIILGVGLGCGIISGARVGSYIRNNRKLNTAINDADTHADVIFGTDRWQQIKSEIDNAPDDKAGNLLQSYINNAKLNNEQKQTIVDYTVNTYIKRGNDISHLKNAIEDNISSEQQEVQSAYENGQNARDAQMNEVKTSLDEAEKHAAELLGEDELNALDGVEDVDAFKESNAYKSYSEEQRETALKYIIARTAYNGMINRVQDEIKAAVNKANAEIDNLTHKDSGTIIRATLKNGDQEVYVVSGNVAMSPDGKSIDTEKSDNDIVVYNTESGKKEMLNIKDLQSVDTPIDAATYKANNAAETTQQIAETEAAKIDGVRNFHYNDTVKVQDKDGNLIDGSVQDVTPDGIIVVSDAYPGGKTYTAAELTAMQPQPQTVAENATVEQQAEEAVADNESNEAPVEEKGEANSPQSEATQQEETTEPQQQTAALERIPKDESGQPLYEQTDPETAWDAIVEQTEGDTNMAQAVTDDMVSDLEDGVKKAERTKTKSGGSIAEKIAAEKERAAAIERAKATLAHWRKIAAVNRMREAAIQAEEQRKADERTRVRKEEEEKARVDQEEAERIKRETLNSVPDFIEDKAPDARARGYRRVNGDKVDRQEPIDATIGKEVQVKFDDDNIPTGHVAIIEANQLQPSHKNGQRNPQHFIDEAQPKERKDDASVGAARKIAANIRPEEITSSVTAYTGAPTVNSRGEVIQGNNRSAALREMWDNHQEQGDKYKQYLIDNAKSFGLKAEDIAAMDKPVLVNMLDVNDEQAISLGQFVASDTESGGTERIKPKNVVKKLGDKMKNFTNILLRTNDENVSFAELVDSNGANALKWLNTKGVISPTQYKSAFDSKGNLTAEAKNDIKGIMYQSIFEGGNTQLEEMFYALPAKAQKAILATAYRDYDSPQSERMIEDIQNSIMAYYALSHDSMFMNAKNHKEARIAVEAWRRQLAFDDVTGESYLPAEKYSNFALLLATMYKGDNQSLIQGTFNRLYDLIQGTQEKTLFEQPDNTPRTLVQAIKETLNIKYDGQQRSNVLAGDSSASQEGRTGSNGDATPGGRGESIDGAEANQGGTEADSGEGRPIADTTKTLFEYFKGGIKSLIEKSKEQNNSLIKAIVGSVTNRLKEDLHNRGIDITNDYKHTIDNNAIRHALNRHGGEKERLQGQLPVTEEDIENISDVINNYDDINIEENKRGQKNIVYKKSYPNGFTIYIEEVRTGRKELAMASIRKKATLTDANSKTMPISDLNNLSVGKDKKSSNTKQANNEKKSEHQEETLFEKAERIANEGEQKSNPTPRKDGESITDYAERVAEEHQAQRIRKEEEAKVDTNPTEAQKEAGNYKKGHIKVDGLNITIEQPKGSIRRGTDANGKQWESEMHNTYGYIRGTESVDGDHIDIFLSDNPTEGKVFVVDQVNKDGSFDEHKVMYGFPDMESARQAYLSNYEEGWQGLGNITEVSKEYFKKWIDSSKRKTKPFAEYTSVKTQDDTQTKKPTEENAAPANTETNENYAHNSEEIMHEDKDSNAANLLTDGQTKHQTKKTKKESKDNNVFLSQKEYVEKELKSILKQTRYKTLEEWESKDVGDYSEKYDDLLDTYEDYVRDLADDERLQAIYDSSSVKAQKEMREHLTDADLDYHEFINTSPKRIRIQERLTRKSKYAKGEFADGTIVSGEVIRWSPESLTVNSRGTLYTIKANKVLQQSDKPMNADEHEYQRDASLQYSGETLANDTEAKQKATEAVLAALSKAGIEVVRATDEEVKALLSNSHATTLRTPQGTIYGWSVNGKIYLTEAGINPDTPIHEYTHLWAEAMMIKNKKGWDSIKSLLKDTPVWKEVIADPNYSNIKDNEDAVASEVLSRISGKKNAAKMEEEAQRAIDEAKGVFEKARATTILTNLKKALNSLWKWVSKNIFDVKEFSSINEVTDKVLYDLIHGTKLINDKSLIGVHNISEQKLRKVLKQGGFANPSIAVIDTDKQVHNDYGEISLILPSRKVNKSTGKNVGTYEGDAWTPMYPIIEKQMSSDGSLIMHNDINSVPNEMQSEVRNALNRWLDNGSDTDLSYLYLFQQGKAPKMATVKPKYSNEVYKSLRDIMFGVDSVYNLTKGEVKNLVELYVQTELNGDIDEYNKANERRIAKYKEAIESGRTNSMYYKIAERNLEEVKKYGYPLSSLKTFADDVQRDKTKQGSKNVQKTLSAASQIIKDAGLEEDFRNWVEGLNNRYQTKEVIFDGFTPTGKRRYIPNTLENVSKLMKKQGRQASTGLGVSFSNFAASVMKANGSLANIRKKKSKLTNEHKDIENFEEKWKEVYFDLAMKLQPNASTFDDYGFTRLQEAALEADPQAFLSKEYGVTLSKEDVRKLQQMVKAIQEERPAMYFETKFERPVTLNEFSKAVVPEDLSDDLQKTLRDNGIEIFTYKRGDAEDRQKATQEAAYSSDDIAFQIISNGNNEANNDSDTRFQIVGNSLSDEEKKIVETAKANDTYMKAPNGKPTNLSEKQWAQVRTKAFKKWFGDWEKAARIEKLRRSKAVKITGEEIEPNSDLKQYKKNALEYGKNLRGEYTNKDTGETIALTGGNSRGGMREILQHDYKDIEHLQSIAAIPQIIEKAIFVDEAPNEDAERYPGVKSFRYYVCGLKIGNTYYTVKAVVAVQNNGDRYYDHKLSSIEKGKLLSIIPTIQKAGIENNLPPSVGKDKRLLSILQTNSSKVVDENGEPMVVYHGTLTNDLRKFSTDFIGSRYSYDEKGFFFISNRRIANDYSISEFNASRRGEVIDAYVSLRNPLVVNSEWCKKNGLGSNVFKDNDVIEFWDNYQSLMIEESERNDGVIITDGEISMVVAFAPNQIKSATGNNGNFSTTEDDILYRTVFGGNSGYVGYSMSKRAAEAKEEGRYPKTEFRREYHITAKSLDMLISLGFIDNSEWHHTSMYGNKTHFYGWVEDELADDYLKHKKEIDTLCKGIDPKTKQPLLEKVEKPQYEHEYEMPQYGEAETAANPIREWRHKQIEKYDQFTGFKGYADATEEEKKERDAYLHSINEQMEEKIREMLAKDYPDYLAAKNALDAYNNYEEDLRKAIGEHIKEYLDIDKYSQRWREQTTTTQPTANVEELTEHAESVVQNLHLNNVEIVPDGSSLNGEQATAKGFYNKRTGKIVVVAGNHTDIADIEKTVLHEAVAHHGLRELFGDNFDNFLDTVFAKADIETRQQIAHLSAKHGWNVRTATEEYLASMAEDTNFEQIKPTLWQRIKQLFGEIMSAFGLHHANITDNDLRYILWRSYKNLQNSGKHSILDKAEDIAMQYRLKTGNYAGKATDNVLYRSGIDPTATEVLPDARTRYEKETKEPDNIDSVPKTHNFFRRFYKSYVDSMLALKSFTNSVLEATGDKMASHEDTYKAENAMTSKNKTDGEVYNRDYYNPLLTAAQQLCEAVGMNYDALNMYMVAKHGLERNEYMGKRAAQNDENVLKAKKALEDALTAYNEDPTSKNEAAVQKAQEKYTKVYNKALEVHTNKDYSGLTELTGKEDVAEAEYEAQKIVDAVETPNAMPKVTAFWSKVNAATKQTLKTGYESGIMTKDTYEHILNMYKYYIPLRGWAEPTADDVYTYYNNRSYEGKPLTKTAKGRTSLAEDPMAIIASMAQRSIIEANRNKMKQTFLNFVLNHPTSLATVGEQWYIKNALGEWERSDANIPANATPDEISKIIEEHELEMQRLAEQGEAIKQRNGLKLDKRVINGEGAEHTIKVWRGGKEYIIYINGNPAVAQAVNGLTNPDTQGSDLPKWAKIGAAQLKNFLSGVYTSFSPAFVLTNFTRDQLFASQAVYIKYGLKYKRQASKNARNLFFSGALPRLVYKWEHGTLDLNNETERYFDEFMRGGGETGFTALRDIESIKKEVKDAINGNKANIAKRGWKSFINAVEFANRSAEDFSRFVTFMTSRQQGKNIVDSIYDAKDITVNFNKKGSGEMGSRFMNFAYIFFNAAVQSINNFGTMLKQHPARTMLIISKFGALGFGVPMLNAFLMALCGGGDDDKYWDNMDWVRRNNIVLRIPFLEKTFISIPLPQELRPFYGMGEIAASILFGKETFSSGLQKAVEGFTGLLPIDFTGNGGNLSITLTPTVLQPVAQYMFNTDYFGRKVYNDNEKEKFAPGWTKAFSSTPPVLIEATKFLNSLTGGNDVDRGAVSLNPDVINHFVKGYFGGPATFVTQMSSLLYKGFKGDAKEIRWRDVPVASRFVQQLDERSVRSSAQGSYKDFKEETEETEYLLSNYKKQVKMGKMEYAKMITDLIKSPEYQRYKIAKAYKKPMDLLKETLNHIDNTTDKKEVEKALTGLRHYMMETVENEQKGKHAKREEDFNYLGDNLSELNNNLKYSLRSLKRNEEQLLDGEEDDGIEELISEDKEITMRIIREMNKLFKKK